MVMRLSLKRKEDIDNAMNILYPEGELHPEVAKDIVVETVLEKKLSKSEILHVLDLATEEAQCYYRKVGAVLVLNDKIIGMGNNRHPEGQYNPCIEQQECCKKHEGMNCMAIHAEVDCILNALKKGFTDLSNAELYCEYSPCVNCSLFIAHNGIKKVHYRKEHHRTDWKMLEFHDIQCEKIEGYGQKS